MPVDQKEQERLDIVHTMIKAVRPRLQRLHHAPFNGGRDPRTGAESRVLDVGHGTGIWCLEMAEQYPEAQFFGFDMANMDPKTIHTNVDLRPGFDYEMPWTLGEASFDLIHLSQALGSVGNWPVLYDKIFKHVRPGGWFEHVEIDWQPRCENVTLRPGSLFTEWWERYVMPPYGHIGRPIEYNPNTGRMLEERGFVNIRHEQFRIPTSGWSNQRHEHVAGHWWIEAMDGSDDRGAGLEAMSLAILTRIQRWTPDHARRLCQDVMREATNANLNAFNNLHVWYAQRPG